MLGAKRSHSQALGSKHNNVDLIGAKMIMHADKKAATSSEHKAAKLEKKQ